MDSRTESSTRKPNRTDGEWMTEYVVLQHVHDPRTSKHYEKHSTCCGAFRHEVDAVGYVKRLTDQDKSQSPIVDLTSQVSPPKSYKHIGKFLKDKESLDLILSGGKCIGIGYHYKDESTGRERMLWIQESRGIVY